MTQNTPIPDAALAELDRLHAAATPGELQARGFRLSHTANRRIDFSVEHLDEIGQLGTGPYQAIPFARREDAEWHAALHNAYLPLRQRLTDAESRLAEAERDRDELEAELEETRANSIEYEKDCTKALCGLAREFDYEWDGDGATADELREFISETVRHLRGYRDAEAVRRAKADCYDRICEHLGVESNVLGAIAARDAQQRREGAAGAESLWRIMYEPSFLGITAMTAGNFKAEIYGVIAYGDTPAKAIEQAAQRLREGK